MERAISVEERIKRAEDIYNKRNGIYSNPRVERKETRTKTSKKRKLVRKMFMQIFICLMIYVCFYAAVNSEYVFSEEFRNEMSSKFSKDNFDKVCENIMVFINKNILRKETSGDQDKQNEENADNEENANNGENADNEENADSEENSDNEGNANDGENNEAKSSENGVGGASEQESSSSSTEELTEAEQMQKDAEYIKSKISFIVPVEGTISSTFGWRTPTTSTVPKYHTGLDIATTAGTVIKSATDGTVTLVSSEGDYGNHYKIQVEDIIIIYAHCKKLYLKEGANVKQGQEIAEVGSTGNSTRTTSAF